MSRARRIAMAGPSPARRPVGPLGRMVAVGVVAAVVIGIVVVGRQPAATLPTEAAVGADNTIHSAPPPLPGHEIYGFVPYWEFDATIAAHLRKTDATTIALFSVTHTVKGNLATNQNGYRKVTGPIGRRIIADAHAAGRRVDLTWTSFGRTRNSALFGSAAVQKRLIRSLVDLRAELGVDGIAVDVEEIDDANIAAYGTFVGRLREALRAADGSATVTVATGAGRQGAALALVASLAGVDRVFMMGYDYRTVRSPPGGSAPLARRDGEDRSLAWSLDLYEALGVPVQRTVLGLPLYGLAWPTADAELGAGSTGRGEIWVPRRNLASLSDPGVAEGYDPVEAVQFLAVPDGDAWRSVYYDSPGSLRPKLAIANERGLAGAGFWALGYERGLPDYTNLIADFRAGRSMASAPRPVSP